MRYGNSAADFGCCPTYLQAPEILENRVPRCFEADVYALGMVRSSRERVEANIVYTLTTFY